MTGTGQQNAGSADEATQGGEAPRDFSWAEAAVWTKRMLSALVNSRRLRSNRPGVKGGKWYALMDKVFAPNTLAAAWTRVRANQGAAGSDECFAFALGWAERRAVRGSGGRVSGRAVDGAAGGLVPPASRQTGRHPEGRWQDAAVGHPDGRRPHRPAGGSARDRTDFRGGVPRRELRLSSGTRMPRRGCGKSIG